MKKNIGSLISASPPKAQGRLTGNFILETGLLKKNSGLLSPLLLKTVGYRGMNLTQTLNKNKFLYLKS